MSLKKKLELRFINIKRGKNNLRRVFYKILNFFNIKKILLH